jgi:uncharacterized protein
MPSKLLVANLFEFAIVAAGWLLLWRLQRSARLQGRPAPTALHHWNVTVQGFGLASLCVMSGWLGAQILAGLVVQQFPALKTDQTLMVIVGGSMAQLCLIAGTLVATTYLKKTEPQASATTEAAACAKKDNLFIAALVTCTITIAIVHPVQFLWEHLLIQLRLPTDKQDMVEMFFRTASPARLFGLSFMAVVLAPIGEELVFRGGLFSFMRGRVPRILALIIPSLLFALLHKALITIAPLMALSIVFSLAYERTGRIAVPILAHALFNLHTVIFLLLGVGE